MRGGLKPRCRSNGYAKNWHSPFRDECPAMRPFLEERVAQKLAAACRHEYNTQRLDSSLDYPAPAGLAAARAAFAFASGLATHACFPGQPCSETLIRVVQEIEPGSLKYWSPEYC